MQVTINPEPISELTIISRIPAVTEPEPQAPPPVVETKPIATPKPKQKPKPKPQPKLKPKPKPKAIAPKHPAPVTPAEQEKGAIRNELRSTQKWLRLKEEFSTEELKFFEEEYVSIMRQFKGNVLHTEEGQIFDAVKLEILKSRNMIARRQARQDIDDMEMEQINRLATFQDGTLKMTDKQKAELFELENKIQAAKSREEAKTVEWDKLQQRVEKIRSALMSNRDQRIKEIEDKSENLLGVIRQLQDRDVQERKSRELQLGSMAGAKESERLSQSIEYDDGSWDSPILSVESSGEDAE